jgi:hypothetical protein
MTDIKLSKSKLLEYNICPRMFYFRHFTTYGKIRKQSSPQLERGSILHEIYEAYNTNPIKYEEYCNSDFVKSDPEYVKNIEGFEYLLQVYNLPPALYAEEKMEDYEWNFSGYIDAIYKMDAGTTTIDVIKGVEIEETITEDEYWVIDYKTGKFHPNKNADYMMELYIYEKLANDFLNQKHQTENVQYVARIGMLFTNQPEVRFVKKVKKADRTRSMKRANVIIEKIRNDEFSKVGTMCRWCSFAGICDEYSDDVLDGLDDHVIMVV